MEEHQRCFPPPCDCCPVIPAEAPYSEAPSSCGYDPEEGARRHDPLSYGGSPPSSPRLRSKSRSSRDTQSSGSLESTLSVRITNPNFKCLNKKNSHLNRDAWPERGRVAVFFPSALYLDAHGDTAANKRPQPESPPSSLCNK